MACRPAGTAQSGLGDDPRGATGLRRKAAGHAISIAATCDMLCDP